MRDQLVAVKVFKVDAPPEQAEQIAEALQAVVQALPRHRGLVEFIAAGVERDTAYLVMSHSDVPSLDSRLKPGAAADSSTPPVDAEQALVIVRTLAEAMDAAHARGIVHGGLHPRDIFVDDRGVCRAAGFGVATALERAGVKVPVRRPYSPPERLTSAPIEPPADRFALGAIAFELLTGRRIAGTGSSAAARYNTSVPGADLDAVRNALAAMLAEQPGHRPSTASAFAQALTLAMFPQGVARASAAAAATGANRSPAGSARDDRRDANTASGPSGAAGPGPGSTAGAIGGAIAAGASNLSRDGSRDGEGDGPTPDDLELFTREGLFTGQPRQHALRWEPVEVENVVPPGEDPLELFAPSPDSESSAAVQATEAPEAPEVSEAAPSATMEARGDAARDEHVDADAEADADADADADAAAEEEVAEVPGTRPGSIPGLATTVVAPREREADDEDADGHETTALPFVPIKADPRLSPVPSSPLASHLHDSVLIDDHSRIDALDRTDHLEHLDRLDHGARVHPGEPNDDLDHLDDLDRFERGHGVDDSDDADDESSSMTPAAAAAAGVVAAGGVSSSAADLSASHSAHHSHASHTEPGGDFSNTPEGARLSAPSGGDREYDDRTPSSFDREAREAETWVAPTTPVAPSIAYPSSTLMDDQAETSDVGSSVRVVGLVLALGLAVGGAGGYLLGQRSALRNASTFDQAERSGDAGATRPAAGGDQAGAPDAAAPARGSGAASAAGKAGAGSASDSRNPANTPASRAGSSGTAGAAAGSTAAGAPAGASAATGRLTINSTPARADVAIDGVRRGVTPLTLRDLPFGSHTVRVTRGGYAPETRRVNVVAGRPAESISIELEPTAARTRPSTPGAAPTVPAASAGAAAATPRERGSASGLGSLYIVSRPMGARVTVDGRLVGSTPLLLTDVTSGSHTIALQADGHKPWQTTVQVKMGERTRVAGSLEEGRE